MSDLGEALSKRELEVLECVAAGDSNKEIAARLSISQNTVKVHLRNIAAKLGASSRTEAVTLSIQQGLIYMSSGELTVVMPSTATAVDPSAAPLTNQPAAPAKPLLPATDVGPTRRLNQRLVIGLTAVFTVLVVLVGWLGFQQLEAATTATIPFEEQPIGESRWLVSRPLLEKRASFAVAATGLDIYQIGGETAAGVVADVMVYHSSTLTWAEAAAKPTAVADTSAVVLFGEVYVPGGRLASGEPANIMEVYSPANDAWRPAAALPQPIAGGLALTDGSFLYFFGGWNGVDYLNTAYVYDPNADSWRPLPLMLENRAFATGAWLAGQLYIVGGFDGQTESNSCAIFDPVVEIWASCPNLTQARAGAGATVVLNKLYVIGGGLSENSVVTFSEMYDPSSQIWQVVNMPMLDQGQRWVRLGVTHIETRIYALGGVQGEGPIDRNFVYTPLVYQTFLPSTSGGKSNN